MGSRFSCHAAYVQADCACLMDMPAALHSNQRVLAMSEPVLIHGMSMHVGHMCKGAHDRSLQVLCIVPWCPCRSCGCNLHATAAARRSCTAQQRPHHHRPASRCACHRRLICLVQQEHGMLAKS